MNNENKGIHPTGVSSRVWIALVALCVANVVAHLMVMPSLPAQIPTPVSYTHLTLPTT